MAFFDIFPGFGIVGAVDTPMPLIMAFSFDPYSRHVALLWFYGSPEYTSISNFVKFIEEQSKVNYTPLALCQV